MCRRAGLLALTVCCVLNVSHLFAQQQAGDLSRKRVLIIGIDGTRPDALAKARTPNLDRLVKDGAFTDAAQNLGERYQKNDTISGPGWSSILTGVWADKHGVHDNSFAGRNYELFPHFFKRLKTFRPEAFNVSLVSWEPIDQYIVSEADLRQVEPLRDGGPRISDLNVSAGDVKVNTRDGQWHHLLATREGSQLAIYLDGKLVGSMEDTAGQFSLGGEFYFLGRDSRTDGTRFQGQLDDLRFWNRALTPGERQALVQPGDVSAAARRGLVAEYRFQQVNGKSAAVGALADGMIDDTAGHAEGPFPAQLQSSGAPSEIVGYGSPTATSRLANTAWNLPQADSDVQGARVSLKSALKELPTGDFTVSARFRTTNKGRNILFGNYGGSNAALNLELHTNNRVRIYVQPAARSGRTALAAEAERDRVMAENASRILREEDPTAMFVYFHETDATGHSIGFSPEVPEYVRAIENVDQCVGTIMESLRKRPKFDQEDWLTIVCTDHGGIQRTHSNGHEIPEIRTVFLIVSGPSSKMGRIDGPAYVVDVAATALTHLRGSLDPAWQLDGRAVGLKAAAE